MAISDAELMEMEKLLSASGAPALSELRAKFSYLSWTRCDASDVIEIAVSQLHPLRRASAGWRRSLRNRH